MATVRALYVMAVFCLLPHATLAAGAFAVDDAGIVDPGKTQIESWYSHSSNAENLGVADAAYQILPQAELTLRNEYDAARTGRSDVLSAQIKYQWRQGGEGNVASSTVFGFNHSVLENRFAGLYAYVPATWAVSAAVDINADLGWEYDDEVGRHYLTWGLGTAWHTNDQWSFVVETFGKNTALPGIQIGPRWNINEAVELNAIYGRNVGNIPGNWLTAGMTVTF